MKITLADVVYGLVIAALLAWACHSYYRGKEAWYALGCTMANPGAQFCQKAAHEAAWPAWLR